MPDVVRIEPFRPEHAGPYAALNRAWLVQHGLIESHDEAQLTDPWRHILKPGGQIFVALAGTEVIGTCGIVPEGPGTFELAKLAVAAAAQGQGLGRRLVEACVEYARAMGARRVILLSSTRLLPALRLYQRLGFQHRPVPADAHYQTADVYMELELATPDT